jgi:hypothetical protein
MTLVSSSVALPLNAGYACAAIANCGITRNSPCCPSSYHTAFPPLNKSPCPKDHFCEMTNSPPTAKYLGSDLLSGSPGVCLLNAPDCGEEGKTCCISNVWSTTNIVCLPNVRPAGQGLGGYCRTAEGKAWGDWPAVRIWCASAAQTIWRV